MRNARNFAQRKKFGTIISLQRKLTLRTNRELLSGHGHDAGNRRHFTR